MKNIQLLALGVLALFLLGGCGGDSSNFVDEQSDNQQEQQEQENNDTVSRVLNNLLTATSDGSPAVFNYAPVPDSYGEGDYGAGTEEVNFVKYITSKDLDENGEFVKAINLEKDCGYIVKYSHSGRDLGSVALNLRITTPDEWERTMYLDFSGGESTAENSSAEFSSSEVSSIDDLSEEEIARLMAEGDMTREELAAEIELSNQSYDIPQPLYIPARLEIVPEENPCAIFYMFKAPMSGVYKFAFRETVGGLPSSLDVPLEVRVYRSDESYSAGDDEELQLTPREIVDIQRMLLNSATEFNENGLPVAFESDEGSAEGSGVRASDGIYTGPINSLFPPTPGLTDGIKAIEEQHRRMAEEERRKNSPITIASYIHNVPYDENLFEDGVGFYAHNGMRSVTGATALEIGRDDDYSENAVEDFEALTPVKDDKTGSVSTKTNFKVSVIGTEEEHDRAMEIDSMSNFALIGNALGFWGKTDDVKLGLPIAKTVHVCYEVIETEPRYLEAGNFKLKSAALTWLQRDPESFRRNFGDYFVAGYTWGMRYEVMIEITSNMGGEIATRVTSEAAELVKDALKASGATRTKLLSELSRLRSIVNLSVKSIRHTGRSDTIATTFDSFLSDFDSFVASSKSRAQYEPLYVSLIRYREIPEARQYISETIPTSKGLYDKIRDLTMKVYRTRCYYNSLGTIHSSNLRNGSLPALREFNILVEEMLYNVNRICADESKVNDYYSRFDALYNQYKALAERYGLYMYLMTAQQKNGYTAGWTYSTEKENIVYDEGFQTYDKSNIVQEDFGYTEHFHYEEDWDEGKGYARYQDSFGNKRIHYFSTGPIKTNKSWSRDENGSNGRGPTIGCNSVNWYYKGAASRRLEVYMDLKLINMPPDKYPFVGLW
ncbi:MAG: hypothetical protein IJR85_04200 [Synergistaceae bacterium]|nr:hypothetical protein [Synergistaceae bacterium]